LLLGDVGVFKISMSELPKPELLKIPELCMDVFMKVLSILKTTLSKDYLIENEEFIKETIQDTLPSINFNF
jgi:hypothetical protein